ncbi:hypothetical protein HK102_012419, partial [Quaeritorhiza haematococci]
MRRFIVMLMIAKIGFIANEAVTGLKLLEKGFHKEDLALAWLTAYYGRLAFALIGMFIVRGFPEGGVTGSYFVIVMASTVLTSFM